MPLIRPSGAPVPLRPFSLADIQQQADAILQRARTEAQQILAAAQVEAQALRARAQVEGREEGRRQGYADGHAEGLRKGHDAALAEHRERLASATAALSAALDAIERSRRDLQAAALADVINLSIAIAERVTKRMGELDRRVASANVAEALRLVGHASDVRIAVNPRDLATLQRELPEMLLNRPDLQHVAVVEDASLAPGGCRLYTAQGMVDGDLDVQLRRIAAELLPEPADRPSPPSGRQLAAQPAGDRPDGDAETPASVSGNNA